MSKKRIYENLKEYHFQFRHITILFIILIILQLIISFINKATIRDFLRDTQEWYQRESAEELANLTTANLELLLETIDPAQINSPAYSAKVRQTFNIIFSQQSLQHDIRELCFIAEKNGKLFSIDDGAILYRYLFTDFFDLDSSGNHKDATQLFRGVREQLIAKEEIKTISGDDGVFKIFVPLVVRGEYIGTMYVKMQPDFSMFTEKISASYNESSIIYLSLMLLGLVAMYFVSSYTVKERDEVQKQLLAQHEETITKDINYQKELLFTKRIYHTHHKAEKIMGFIKEDLRLLTPDNIAETQFRMTKYSNFISRVIYDMKWFDPPVQTIRNQIFQTDLKVVLNFLIDNVFLRTSTKTNAFEIVLDCAPDVPFVEINEFVVWEILEPLIQNSIDHGGEISIKIGIKTSYDAGTGVIKIEISDNGKGLPAEMLAVNEKGINKLFLESTSMKKGEKPNSGYGCYIAYEMCKKCGWVLNAENFPDKGCIFTIVINNRV